MKKLILLLVAAIVSMSLMAQNSHVTKVLGIPVSANYGAKFGIDLTSMSNNMSFAPNFKMGAGFQFGTLVNLHFGKRTASSLPDTGLWGLQPELLFSNQVTKSDGGDVKLNYIKVPVMLKVYPLARLSVEAGPEFSYLISSSPESIKVDGVTVKVGDCKGFNLGAGVGAAYEFNFGLMVGARYSMGFTDLGKNLKWKNNSNIQITAGWLF